MVGGNLNTQLHFGARGILPQQFTIMFDWFVANSDTSAPNWSSASSTGNRRRIDFILSSTNWNLQDAHVSDKIGLGSDDGVHATFCLPFGGNPPKKKRRTPDVGWAFAGTKIDHRALQEGLTQKPPGTFDFASARPKTSQFRAPAGETFGPARPLHNSIHRKKPKTRR